MGPKYSGSYEVTTRLAGKDTPLLAGDRHVNARTPKVDHSKGQITRSNDHDDLSRGSIGVQASSQSQQSPLRLIEQTMPC